MRSPRLLSALLALSLCVAGALPCLADPADLNWDDRFNWSYGPDFPVQAMARDGGSVYIGGSFSRVDNTDIYGVAFWNGSTFSPLGTGIAGTVRALARDGSGNLYAAGTFASAGGGAASNIARWNGTSWSALGTGINGTVYALAVDGSGTLYEGGLFSLAGGVAASSIARWDGASWSALGAGVGNVFTPPLPIVYALACDGSNVYVGGSFALAGAAPAANIARWDGSSWSALGDGTDSDVFALTADGAGNVYAGGVFQNAGTGPASFIAKWDGASWSALGAGMDNAVFALALDASGDLVAGGAFSTADGNPAYRAARWNGASWSDYPTLTTLGSVYALAPRPDGSLLAGGSFYFTAGGASPLIGVNLAMWSGGWAALQPGSGLGLDYQIRAFARSGATLFVAGDFGAAGDVIGYGIDTFAGGSWTNLTPNLLFPPLALAMSGGDLYAGGLFSTVSGDPDQNGIAKWNGTAWSGLAGGIGSGRVSSLATAPGGVYAGGTFTTIGGTSANRIARWDGTSWSALGDGTNGEVVALALDGGNLYAGGVFTSASSVANTSRIAKWDGSTWSALGTGTSGTVNALVADGLGNLYAGGSFLTAGGGTVNRIAKWNGSAWTALGTGMDNSVLALAMDAAGNLYAGGSFTHAGGTPANRVAVWNGSTWSALGSGVAGSSGIVRALHLDPGGNLYAGGNFITAGAKPSYFIATWLAPPVITASAGPGGSISPSGSTTVTRGTDPMYTITPDGTHAVDDVLVDGGSVGPVTSYTFTNVMTSHTISASFMSITAVESGSVTEFALSRVTPNPVLDRASIDYSVAQAANVRLTVLDLQGRVQATLADGPREAGRYRAVWHGASAAPGMYFVRYEAAGKSFTQRLLIAH